MFYAVAEQIADEPFAVTLQSHERFPFLQSQGFLDICQGGWLVPGARIRLLRTERSDLYKLLYTPVSEQSCRILFFEPPDLRPQIREVTFACEVDPDMLLTEARFGDMEALDALFLADRRTAPKVLASIFEAIGEQDEAGVFHARFCDLFPLLCVTKPYSLGYVRQILSRCQSYPWFYPGKEEGLYCYDSSRSVTALRPPRGGRTLAGSLEGASDVWRAIGALAGRQLHTLGHSSPFRMVEIGRHHALVEVGSTGRSRRLDRAWLEGAWERLVERGELTLGEIRDNFSDFNPAYIAAILAELSGVTHTEQPILLRYAASPEAKAPEKPAPEVRAGAEPPDLSPKEAPPPPQGGVQVEEPYPPVGLDLPRTEKPVKPQSMETERQRTGQLVAIPLVPPGPLFVHQPTAQADSTGDQGPEATTPAPEAEQPLPTVHLEGPLEPPPPQPTQSPTPSAGRSASPQPHRDDPQTKTLFSRHYLETRLPGHPEWAEDPRPAFDAVRALWRAARPFRGQWNEAQTEDEFVRPVLQALGWAYTVQTKVGAKGQVTRPDYALFDGAQAKAEADLYLGQDDPFYARARAVAEAKYWGRSLSQADASGRDAWKAGNPGHQMVGYLAASHVAWGILTNGAVWRLYSREASSIASEFYEIDLAALFDSLPEGAEPSPEQLDLFRRWWLLFRRDAFTPDAQGRTFLQRVQEGSATYAREISNKLKELVFQQVVPEIAGGFVAYRRQQQGIAQETDESLREVYGATLGLLYKLLFLLYAEARSLLPMDNPSYREQSLTALAQWAAERLDKKQPLSAVLHATPRYDALLSLFCRVDQGDPSLGIPRYNGGLFNPAAPENSFLEKHRLSDRAVARAVDVLVRDAGQPVDYAYISVRNLGAIYEGLLENKLKLVDAVAGRVELVNDKGERKSTGSYYTPDYIVEYIVQHTLDPILEARAAQFGAAMDRCSGLRGKLKHTTDPATVGLLRGQLDEAERDAREAFLGIKVCDPAMGSGHFLVNAVDHLTDGIILRLQAYHGTHPDVPWEWNPIQRLIERVRTEVLAEMGRQGIAVDPGRLDDTALLTRLVMKRCIYGVDLNPLAVELAKLSLWLHSFTVGAPLSFLDHHLRWGNSLIGSDVRSMEAAVKETKSAQLALFAGPFAGMLDLTAMMVEVAEQADATLADVQQSAERFGQFQAALLPYKQVLDLWVSQHFANPKAKEFVMLHRDDVLPALREGAKVAAPYQAAIEQARTLWREKRFFHWDLEFPEVFVDLRKRDWAENPGFDVVIGNPPYDELSEDARGREIVEMAYYEAVSYMASALGYRVNLYRLFVAQALHILRQSGWHSFIVPLSLLADQFTLNLRRRLLDDVQVRFVEQFAQKDDPRDRVFLDAKLSTCIYVVCLASPEGNEVSVRTHPGRQPNEDSPSYVARQDDFARLDAGNLSMPGVSQESWNIIYKLATASRYARLGAFAHAFPGELMINREFEPYLADPTTGEEAMRGSHIAMYEIVLPKQGQAVYFDREKYLAAHAQSAKAQHHRQSRVVYQRYAAIDNYRRLIGTILPSGFLCSHTVGYLADVTQYDKACLLSLLNSHLLDWRFNLTSTNNNINGYELEALPIPLVSFTTPAADRQRHADRGRALYDQFLSRHDEAPMRSFVAGQLEAGRSDVVHDLLAFLAEQMIEMHKQKQAHQKDFRLDLAGYLDAKQIEKLSRLFTPPRPPQEGDKNLDRKRADYEVKRRLAEGQLGPLAAQTLDLEDFWRLSQVQWMGLLRARLGDVANMSKLAAVYDQYHKPLAPLMRRIERTDWLIDQVVYQLYGLTEEEIAIVEGLPRTQLGGTMTGDQDPATPDTLPNAAAKRLHLEFWTSLLDRARRQDAPTARRPTHKHYLTVSAGTGGRTHYSYVIHEDDAQVALIIDGSNAAANKRTFDQLHAAKQAIETAFGGPLEWERLDEVRRCRIAQNLPGGGLRDRNGWPEIQDRLIDAMVRLEKALRPHIQRLPNR